MTEANKQILKGLAIGSLTTIAFVLIRAAYLNNKNKTIVTNFVNKGVELDN